MKKKFAGVYTGKYKIGQRVNSGDTYPTGVYHGAILSILTGRVDNNAYAIQWDGDVQDDGSPVLTYMSETDIVPE